MFWNQTKILVFVDAFAVCAMSLKQSRQDSDIRFSIETEDGRNNNLIQSVFYTSSIAISQLAWKH